MADFSGVEEGRVFGGSGTLLGLQHPGLRVGVGELYRAKDADPELGFHRGCSLEGLGPYLEGGWGVVGGLEAVGAKGDGSDDRLARVGWGGSLKGAKGPPGPLSLEPTDSPRYYGGGVGEVA